MAVDEQLIQSRVPDGQWCIVDVTFPDVPGADLQIPHTLSPPFNEGVEYTVLRQATPGSVYEDRSATRTPWGRTFIILRSDQPAWTGRLLLRVLKTPVVYTPGENVGVDLFPQLSFLLMDEDYSLLRDDDGLFLTE